MQFLNSVSNRALCAMLAVGVAGAVIPTQAFAQTAAPQAAEDESEGLEEIVVTAQRRKENLQDVPISVTAISAATLSSGGVSGLTQLNQAVPSIQVTRSGPSAIFFIRGVGNSSGGTGEEGANAFYVDGVYLGDLSQAGIDFNNIERIEVLKGPQGTLFGRNSSGGLVHIITREPGDEVVVKGTLGYGNAKTKSGQLYVASPLTEKLSADIALMGKDQSKGFGTNLATGEDVNKGWVFGARSKLVYRPGDLTKIVLSADYRRSHDDYTNGFTIFKGTVGTGGATYVGDYNINSLDSPGFASMKVWGVALNVEHEFDWGTLTSITGRRKVRTISVIDADYTPAPLTRAHITSGSKSFQEELRLASAATKPFSWQVGLFYYQGISDVFNQAVRGTAVGGLNSGFDLSAHMKTTSYAAFGEVSYDLTDTTHLTGGIRYTKDKRDFTGKQVAVNQTIPALIAALTVTPPPREISYGRATWRLAVRQDLTDDINVYGSYNRGFKSGIFAMQSPANPPVKPQTIDAFEVGVKSQLFDNKVRFNLAGFHYKIKDFQVRSTGGIGSTTLLLNAASVKVDGVEAELEVAPTKGLRLTANGAYLKSRFADFPGNQFYYQRPATCNAPGVSPPGQTTGPITGGYLSCFGNAGGNRVPLSPRFAANVGGTYTANVGSEGQLIFTGQWSYTAKAFFEADNVLSQPSYSLITASVEYRPSANWGIELWGRNIGDKQYYITGATGGTGAHGELGMPRTYGVNVKFDF